MHKHIKTVLKCSAPTGECTGHARRPCALRRMRIMTSAGKMRAPWL